MTLQRPDMLRYKNEDYHILLRFGQPLFGLKKHLDLGITHWLGATNSGPVICGYLVENETLFLENIIVGAGETVLIDGIAPTKNGDFEAIYRGLRINSVFSGKFLAGRGHVRNFPSERRLWQDMYSFETVTEFQCEDGKLLAIVDHSPEMEAIRQLIIEDSRWTAEHYKNEFDEIARLQVEGAALREQVPIPRNIAQFIAQLSHTEPEETSLTDEEIEAKREEIFALLKPGNERVKELYAIIHSEENREALKAKIDAIFFWDLNANLWKR